MAVQITLELEGITGESKIQGFEGNMDVYSWSWGMVQTGTWHTGGGGGGGQVSVQDIVFTKKVDRATTDIIKLCCKGEHIPTGKLVVTKAGGSPLDYLTIEMKKIIIANYNTGGAPGDEEVMETIALNFAWFDLKYKQQADDGSVEDEDEAIWNIEANAPG